MKQTFAATAAIRRLIIERKENVSKVNAAAIHPVKSTAVMIGPPARPAACSMQHQLRNSTAGSKRRARRHVRVRPGVGPVHREVLRLRAPGGLCDRKSVVSGKSVAGRVATGGLRIIHKKQHQSKSYQIR